MAKTNPTPVSFVRAISLVLLLLFRPEQFSEVQRQDNELLNAVVQPTKPTGADVVRRAFFSSFILVLLSAAVGYGLGFAMSKALACVTSAAISWVQILGTCLLLWGTLFVRGWQIQTYGGISLTERVNQWIYRALYFVGTAMLVASLALPTCRP